MVANIKDDRLEIKLVRDVTASWVEDKLDQVRGIMNRNKSYEEVVVGMEKVEIIDSIGISFIIAIYKTARELGKGFKVIGLNEEVKNLFKMMRLDEVFNVRF